MTTSTIVEEAWDLIVAQTSDICGINPDAIYRESSIDELMAPSVIQNFADIILSVEETLGIDLEFQSVTKVVTMQDLLDVTTDQLDY